MKIAPITMSTNYMKKSVNFGEKKQEMKPLIKIDENTPDDKVVSYGTWGSNYVYPITAGQIRNIEADKQKDAIIYYENTYMQNSGVDYKSEEVFDVVSILDGTVIEVKEDAILGNVVQIKHTNDIISVYQSLSEVDVKKDDKILAGQIIGKSGQSNINKDIGNHLHFELYYQGQIVNPEEYYDKNVEDL